MGKGILLLGILCMLSFITADEVSDEAGANEPFHWGYSGSTGADRWRDHYPICAGKRQSPINIDPKRGVYSELLKGHPIKLLRYNEKLSGVDVHLNNNGHTATVRIGNVLQHEVGIVGGGLPSQYILGQFHWHWGKKNDRGSEHTYGGKMYPMEMHLVHFNRLYADNETAVLTSRDGLAVLGVFIEVGEHNPAFDPIVNFFADTSKPDATEFSVPIELPSLEKFLPKDLAKFYRYEGSLTTPPCYESVMWTVFKEPIQISQDQLDMFRNNLKKDRSINRTPSADNYINDNYRPVQPLNDRTVFVSYGDDTEGVIDSSIDHLTNWGYYDSGHGLTPNEWHKKFELCGGMQQSPIHIEHSKAVHSPEISASPFNLINYDKLPNQIDILLDNNGHTVTAGFGDGIGVSGGGLPAEYRLAQFHLHWGRHNSNGSEHVLNGRQYPAEIHFVHTNRYYGDGKDFDQVTGNHDGLAVLGVLIDVGEHNAALDPVIKQLNSVKYSSAVNKVQLAMSSLRALLPADMSEFYRYAGSLTTPPCYEIVLWTVFKNPITMSQEQLDMLRTKVVVSPAPNDTLGDELLGITDDDAPQNGDNDHGKPKNILDNFRPLQEINYRVLKYAKIEEGMLRPTDTVIRDRNNGSPLSASVSIACLLLCAALFRMFA